MSKYIVVLALFMTACASEPKKVAQAPNNEFLNGCVTGFLHFTSDVKGDGFSTYKVRKLNEKVFTFEYKYATAWCKHIQQGER